MFEPGLAGDEVRQVAVEEHEALSGALSRFVAEDGNAVAEIGVAGTSVEDDVADAYGFGSNAAEAAVQLGEDEDEDEGGARAEHGVLYTLDESLVAGDEGECFDAAGS